MRHLARTLVRWTAALALLAACSGGSRTPADAGGDALDAAPEARDVTLAPDAPGDAADAPADLDTADAEEPRPLWVLPPCYRACDRVTACGVAACQGYDWASAGLLFEACFQACDEAWAAGVLDQPACAGVEAAAAEALADYAAACTANPCGAACDAFAACVVTACEALDPGLAAGIASDCHAWCTPPSSAWMIETPCADLVAALSEGDPGFAQACHGAPSTCAGPDLCQPWADKVTGCIVAHCGGHADAYRAGLVHLLATLCTSDPQCPAPADVQGGLNPAVTCDTPGFDTLGSEPPFTELCAGTVGVTPEQVGQACALLAGCPGAEWLGGVEGCSAFLVLASTAAQRTQCLIAAPDCTGAYACLEGL